MEKKSGYCLFVILVLLLSLILPATLNADKIDKSDTTLLVFRGDYNYPPLEYLDENGQPAGFTVELMQAASEVMGINMDIRLGPWYIVKEELQQGEIDGLIAMYQSKNREENFDFGTPYLYMYHSFFANKENTFKNIENLDKLEKPRVILQNSSFLQQFVLSYNKNAKFIIVDTQVEALRLLAGNKYDFALLPSLQGSYLIDKYKLSNIKKIDQDLLPRGYGFAVKKGDTLTMNRLNQGVEIIKANGKFDEIYNKWFGKYNEKDFWEFFNKYLLIPLIIIVLAFVLTIVTVFILRKQLFERTRLLNQELSYRMKTEEQLKIEKERAEESDRLKSAFLANMSHEIRTPMNAILGFANLLGEEDISPEEQKEYTELINLNSKVLLELINDIIDVAKIEARQLKIVKEPFQLNQFMRGLHMIFLETLKRQDKGHIQLRLKIPKPIDEITLNTDSFRLRQILNNLLGNAIKFTHQGYIEFGYNITEDKLQFYVKDSGIGISEDKKELIFSRFRQVDESHTRNYGGTGLGLSISAGLISLLKGDIWVDSASGKGSVFYFTLPFEEAELQKTEKQSVLPKKLDGIKILVAEDIIHNYKLIESFLKKEDTILIHAQNGREAIDLYRENPDIELVLMDIRMPVMNGFEALEGIRQINKDIPVIALTAYAMADDLNKLKTAGFNDHIVKPVSRENFFETIQTFA